MATKSRFLYSHFEKELFIKAKSGENINNNLAFAKYIYDKGAHNLEEDLRMMYENGLKAKDGPEAKSLLNRMKALKKGVHVLSS